MKLLLALISLLCLAFIPLSNNAWLDVLLILVICSSAIFGLLFSKKYRLIFSIVLLTCPILSFQKWFEPAYVNQSTVIAFKSLDAELNKAETIVSQFFFNNSAVLYTLSILTSQEELISNQQYLTWLNKVLPQERNQFLNVALSENLIIKLVYPQTAVNLNTIGVNQADIPNQGILYRSALATGQELTIGPVMLLQGEPGVILVKPVKGDQKRIIAGVLSLNALKQQLKNALPESIDLNLNISTLVGEYQVLDDNKMSTDRSVIRKAKYSDIQVDFSAFSHEIDRIIGKNQNIFRSITFLIWLASCSILTWQQFNHQQREKQRVALEKSEHELKIAQKVGRMGSWWAESDADIHLSEPLQQLIRLHVESTTLSFLLNRLHPSEIDTSKKIIADFLGNPKQDHLELEHQIKIGNSYRWVQHRMVKDPDGGTNGIVRDIHSIKERDELVTQLESFDALTGAANRHYFKQLVKQNIDFCQQDKTRLALLLINIDDFRAINEKYSQQTGDELLKRVSYRLNTVSRKTDNIARLSGDTFSVSLVDVGDSKDSVQVVEKIVQRLKKPYTLDEDIYPQFTMGIALYPDDGQDYDSLLRMAEAALSAAKTDARGHYRYYSAQLSEQTERRQKILSRIPLAIENNYLQLVYQPRVSVSNNYTIKNMEALVRWQDPELGFVSPGEFIPIAEPTILIAEIGYWVMDQAFAMVAKYTKEIPDGLLVSINLSPRQLEDPSLVKSVTRLLSKHNVDALKFEFEITEHSISENSEFIISNMRKLSELGFQFALDDFGTGYSNLGILQSLPLNVLKVDMSFIRAIGTSKKSDELVRAILNMGRTLGLHVVAEGVESAEQVQFLEFAKCEELQGYYFYKPAPIEKIIENLTQ